MSWFKKIRLHLSKKFVDIIQTTWQCPDSKLIVKLIWQSEQYFGGKKVNASGISLGSWIMSAPTGRTNAEAETPLLWPPNGKSWLTAKDPDAEKDWRQEEKGTTEDEMFNGITDSMDMSLGKLRELVMDREACNSWGCKESDTTEWLNGTELLYTPHKIP